MSKLMYRSRVETETVFRLTDNYIISPHMEKDWAEYQDWLQAGNKPLDPEIIESTPSELTIEEKLASVGLNVDDLKSALGIKE